MYPLSFKNRIAFYYLLSTACLVFVAFLAIYLVVSNSVVSDVNKNIDIEVARHQNEVSEQQVLTKLIDENEWLESEHNEIEINPIFVQIHDKNQRLVQKSPNLKNKQLRFFPNSTGNYYDTKVGNIEIRQKQAPLINKGKIVGYVIIAMSMGEPEAVLHNLKNILFFAFPIVLIVLFFVTSYIAGKSISPVLKIIETSNVISRENLKSRIMLPNNKDELYVLSKTINNLLDRIEKAIEREKQFTSDASHELRTPLAVIKGTLEVLIRKSRDQAEYEEKINFCVTEVDRLNNLVDQLLLLARFENQKQNIKSETVYLNAIILDNLTRFSEEINSKKITVTTVFPDDFFIRSDDYLLSIIIGNLLSNAIKYSKPNGEVNIALSENEGKISCSIADDGIGIEKDDLDKIFNSFYRSRQKEHPEIKGSGLGLSIVGKLAELLEIDVNVDSEYLAGTTVILTF